MRKIILILLSCILLTSCVTKDNSSVDNQEIDNPQIENTDTTTTQDETLKNDIVSKEESSSQVEDKESDTSESEQENKAEKEEAKKITILKTEYDALSYDLSGIDTIVEIDNSKDDTTMKNELLGSLWVMYYTIRDTNQLNYKKVIFTDKNYDDASEYALKEQTFDCYVLLDDTYAFTLPIEVVHTKNIASSTESSSTSNDTPHDATSSEETELDKPLVVEGTTNNTASIPSNIISKSVLDELAGRITNETDTTLSFYIKHPDDMSIPGINFSRDLPTNYTQGFEVTYKKQDTNLFNSNYSGTIDDVSGLYLSESTNDIWNKKQNVTLTSADIQKIETLVNRDRQYGSYSMSSYENGYILTYTVNGTNSSSLVGAESTNYQHMVIIDTKNVKSLSLTKYNIIFANGSKGEDTCYYTYYDGKTRMAVSAPLVDSSYTVINYARGEYYPVNKGGLIGFIERDKTDSDYMMGAEILDYVIATKLN
ncbi:MAG: hypothetical protein IKM20_01305 [Erysipelotrichales bacterium]|nr:hypothetical protein [Erysipelotrichales bacterium]